LAKYARYYKGTCDAIFRDLNMHYLWAQTGGGFQLVNWEKQGTLIRLLLLLLFYR